jgi:methionyl-tRNA formyltransferase
MRLIMMGTGPFAVPTFEALYASQHEVVLLVTAPVREHRGKTVDAPSRMREVAAAHGTPIFDPASVNTPEAQAALGELRADLAVVCDYGQILAPATLAAMRLGGINLHASLLPKYRGAAPINWAIYHGETHTGVTVIHMTPRIDAGPCLAQEPTEIGPEETAAALEIRLAQLGAGLVVRTIDALAAGPVASLPQDAALASPARRLKKTDGAIDWTRPAGAIKNQIRAMEPWPKTYTYWRRPEGAPVRLIFGPVKAVALADHPQPGTVAIAADDRLWIAAGQGAVAVTTVQPAGKRVLGVAEFLRGYPLRPGDRLGAEDETR